MNELYKIFEKEIDEEKKRILYGQFPKFKDRIIPLSMTGVTTRMFQHWKDKKIGIIDYPENEDGREWIRLNLFEYVWLSACVEMRKYGIPLEILKKIKELLFADFIDDLSNDKTKVIDALKKMTNDDNLLQERIKLLDLIKTANADVSEENKIFTTVLGSYLSTIILGKRDVCFIIHHEGKQVDFNMIAYENINEFSIEMDEHIHKSMIMVPLRKIVIDFFTHTNSSLYLRQFELINTKEQKILAAIKKKDFKRLEIIPTNDKKDVIIYEVEDSNTLGEIDKELKKAIILKQYVSITVKQRNGNQLYIETKKQL